MKDIEIGGLLLQKYYEHRRQGFYLTTPEDFNGQLTKEEVLYVSDQLGQQGLLAWKPCDPFPASKPVWDKSAHQALTL